LNLQTDRFNLRKALKVQIGSGFIEIGENELTNRSVQIQKLIIDADVDTDELITYQFIETDNRCIDKLTTDQFIQTCNGGIDELTTDQFIQTCNRGIDELTTDQFTDTDTV
jgi:hypothetical protein